MPTPILAKPVDRRPVLPAVALAVLAAGAISLGGCATRGFVREQVGVVDSRAQATQAQVDSQQTALQGHETRLGELDKTTREALDRAEAAGKQFSGHR